MYRLHLIKKIKISLLFLFVFSYDLSGQKIINLDTIGDVIYLGKFKLNTPTLFKSEYTYDPFTDKYIFSTKAGEINLIKNKDSYAQFAELHLNNAGVVR